jgi:multiple sugar transport system substrate-binding protein
MRFKGLFLLMLAACLLMTACGGGGSGNAGEGGGNAGTGGSSGAEGGGGGSSGGKIEISISSWGAPDERAVFEAVLEEFEKANPDIKVRFIHIPNDYTTKMNTMIAGGTAPDVIFTSDGDFPRWVKQGAFLDITDRVMASTKLDLDDMWEQGLNRYRYDGKKTGTGAFYALPKDIGPTVMYYNKEIFDRLGVPYPSPDKPMTWDEALDMWKKLTVDENGDGKIDIYGGKGWRKRVRKKLPAITNW